MFNITTIQDNLSALVGFSQRTGKKTDRLDADLTNSTVGCYVDSAIQPLLTLENIKLAMDVFRTTDVADWDDDIEYQVADVVLKNSKIWQSIKAGENQDPEAVDSIYWMETNLISAFLRNLRRKSASSIFQRAMSERKLYEVAKTLLTDTELYDATGSLSNLVTNYNRFVGYRIRPKYKDTVLSISSIGFQLNKVAPELQTYFYQTSSKEPVKVVDINHDTAVTFGWHKLPTPVPMAFSNEDIGDAADYFIGYYQQDLPDGCNAIWKQMDWCPTCPGRSSALYQRWSNFFDLQPIYVESTWLNDDRTMFDPSKAILLANQNWGMNFKIQSRCDISDFIVRNKEVFITGLQTQVVHDLLNLLAYTTRDNGKSGDVARMAQYALERTENGDPGYIKRLENEVKNINFDMSKINCICLPDVPKAGGVKTKSVYR